MVSATALDIVSTKSIHHSVSQVIELKRSICTGGCFAACSFGTAVCKMWFGF
jgi:hypothetical protein